MVNLSRASSAISAKTRTACAAMSVLNIQQPGRQREVKQKIVDMALNGSGVRDTARVLHVSPATVIRELKKNRL
jgi:transposase-like protein